MIKETLECDQCHKKVPLARDLSTTEECHSWINLLDKAYSGLANPIDLCSYDCVVAWAKVRAMFEGNEIVRIASRPVEAGSPF